MYADIDFWLALLTQNDDESTAALLDQYGDDLEVSLVTFLQLFALEPDYEFDRERAITAMLTLADYDGEADVLYRASDYREAGLGPYESFHAALGDDSVISSSQSYDDVGIRRLWME